MKLLRNESHRDHIARRVRIPGVDMKALMKTLTASFAKWRYETLAHCFEQLQPLRLLCQQYMTGDVFGNVQELDTLLTFLAACADPLFWAWIECGHKFLFGVLEHLRRWGLVCDCHRQERQARKRFTCAKLGRRLRDAPAQIREVVKQLLDYAKDLTLADCGGSQSSTLGWSTH